MEAGEYNEVPDKRGPEERMIPITEGFLPRRPVSLLYTRVPIGEMFR
jgi:hypothetical protein